MKNTEQIDLFGKIEPASVSIEDSAKRLSVSTATIRNWLKTGYLSSVGRGLISEDSLNHFQNKIAGTIKLNQRANKSLKDYHDHESTTFRFINRAKSEQEISCILGEEYEKSLSDSYRNREGIFYTPPTVVFDLFSGFEGDLEKATFCDPCCGSGNFILRALELGFKPENVYGYDIDPVAVEITRARIKHFCGYDSANIQADDFLRLVSIGKITHFDCIYTNPPWGKKLPKEDRVLLGHRFKVGSSLDTCSLFFFSCLECLNSNGTLGVLLPESFFNISAFESARIKALNYSLVRLVDYGKVFKGLLTRAQAIVLTKKKSDPNLLVKCDNSNGTFSRKAKSFLSNPKSIFNLHCDEESDETLQYLFSIPHINLADKASWGLGIVTGNNENFIRSSPSQGYIPVFKGSDILPDGMNPPSNYIPSDFSIYQQVAPLSLYKAKEKLIYKFISSRLCFFFDTEQRFVLNSANVLIPKQDFPISTKALGALLSSDFMNWIYSSIFNSHKILRGDLEVLPIYTQFIEGDIFNENFYIKQLNIEKAHNGTYRIKK